ncbi:MAG: diacylglycerol kinase family protein [Erysipelotrichaceae bacterium]|nr:diacylglycerol kinase family protein [Erysipelotrichaceae bacterium]
MKSFLARFVYAFEGLAFMMKEKNIRLHLAFALFVIVMGFLFRLTKEEWFWVLLCIALVLSMETINTCIEMTVDSISTKRNLRFKKIKDMAAGAVLIVSLFALIVGLMIFLPKCF